MPFLVASSKAASRRSIVSILLEAMKSQIKAWLDGAPYKTAEKQGDKQAQITRSKQKKASYPNLLRELEHQLVNEFACNAKRPSLG